jgi:hypothetical protein
LIPHINQENLIHARLPDHLLVPKWQVAPNSDKETWTWEANFEAIGKLIGYFQEGTWPTK